MAISNPFSGMGGRLQAGVVGFGAGLAGGGVGSALLQNFFAEKERQRAMEAMNPIRELILQRSLGQQMPFAGGPASELPGAGQSMSQPSGAVVTPANMAAPAFSDRNQLPAELRPPPQIDAVLKAAADRHGVPVNALRALAAQESTFRPGAIGPPIDLPGQEGDQARGLFQFTPEEIAKMPGFDPNDPEQAADETARRLRARLEEGKPMDIALMEHFGGPNQALHGPRTRRYHKEITDKFQRLEAATVEQEPPAPPAPQGMEAGPFGTVMQRENPQQGLVQELLASIAQDPTAFAEQFAGEGGLERIVSMLQGGDGTKQTRVISGDTPEGRSMGILPGERARVEGTVMSGGQFFPMAVKAAPFSPESGEEGGGGPLINLMDWETGKFSSYRRDDPQVDALIRQGHVVATDGQAAKSLSDLSQGEARQLRDAQVGAKTYIATVADGIRMLNENPDINTFVARMGSFANDLKQEAKALAGVMGVEFDENVLSVGTYEGTFRELGIERERMQSLITSLAFQRAVAEKGGAGRITNRDIERFIAEIGGRSSDPAALAQVLQDTAHRAARGFRINFETRTDAPFEGDLGMDQLPRYAPREQFSPDREAAAASIGGLPQLSDGPEGDDQYEQLPSGAEFIAPDGTRRRKP